jgi:hypothetical protein
MTANRILLPLFIAVLAGACASQPKVPPPIELGGFRFLLPIETDKDKDTRKSWVVARQTADQFVVGKPGNFTGDTLSLQGTLVKLPQLTSDRAFREHVEAAQRKALDTLRFRLIKFEVISQPMQDQVCALSHMSAADITGAGPTAPAVNTMLDTLTVTCPHPNNQTRGISVTYSHGYFPEDADPQFFKSGMALLEGLRFDEL